MNYETTQCERCANKQICKHIQDYSTKFAKIKEIVIPITMPFKIDFRCNMFRNHDIYFASGSYTQKMER